MVAVVREKEIVCAEFFPISKKSVSPLDIQKPDRPHCDRLRITGRIAELGSAIVARATNTEAAALMRSSDGLV